MSYTKEQLSAFIACCIGRRSDFAVQCPDGSYARVGRQITYADLCSHLSGSLTLGTYLRDERGFCRSAVFDADSAPALFSLVGVQAALSSSGLPSYLEASRRGGHLRVFLARPMLASQVRRWLLPFCPSDVEFYPKQDEGVGSYGSLMRVPLGVHRLSGRRYPFVAYDAATGCFVPLARSLSGYLAWFATVERVQLPAYPPQRVPAHNQAAQPEQQKYKTIGRGVAAPPSSFRYASIAEWCAVQDPFSLIGRYVTLDARGMGCCPFGEHHSDGKDSHPSLWVHALDYRGHCWYCHAWGKGGSAFDFLRLYYRLDARTLWSRILAGEQF